MSTITVTRNNQGKIVGAGEKDKLAYGRFTKRLHELQPGELFTIDAWFPRNPKLHGLHFAMLTALFDMQEQFSDPDQMRMWVQVGAGHCEFVPGPTGRMVAIPKSISFRAVDDADFAAHHEKVKDFLRSDHARRFLWPTLLDDQTAGSIDNLLAEFERDTA
jgi:hypothetical protein